MNLVSHLGVWENKLGITEGIADAFDESCEPFKRQSPDARAEIGSFAGVVWEGYFKLEYKFKFEFVLNRTKISGDALFHYVYYLGDTHFLAKLFPIRDIPIHTSLKTQAAGAFVYA